MHRIPPCGRSEDPPQRKNRDPLPHSSTDCKVTTTTTTTTITTNNNNHNNNRKGNGVLPWPY